MNPRKVTTAIMPVVRAGASWQSQALALGLRTAVKPMLHVWSYVPGLTWPSQSLDLLSRHLPVPEGTTVRRLALPECPAEWVEHEDAAPDRAILYLHGGAFLCCGLNSHRRLVARISKASGAGVLHVGYRMMPRNTINHAVADALDGYRWLLAHGYRGEDVVVAGDSAGGYLAFMTALEAMDADLPRPAGVVALSPLADMDPAGKRAHANANRCPVFTLRAVEALTDLADRVETRFEVDGVSPERRSPVDADLVGHPRTLIQVGSQEMLLADAELMASRLVAAGVECELQVWERQVHVFQAASWLPEARAAVAEVGEFVKEATAAAMPAVHAHTG